MSRDVNLLVARASPTHHAALLRAIAGLPLTAKEKTFFSEGVLFRMPALGSSTRKQGLFVLLLLVLGALVAFAVIRFLDRPASSASRVPQTNRP